MGSDVGARLQFRMLGPSEVWRDGEPLSLGGERQRALLVLLLIHANELVSSERLIDELFGGERCASAVNALRVAISRLRRALQDGARDGVLMTRPGGYVLEVDPRQLDAANFRALLEQARGLVAAGERADAAARLREALALWRGAPLVDLQAVQSVQAEIRRLEELRLSAVIERIDAELALGAGAELIGELQALVAAEPLQERVRGQPALDPARGQRASPDASVTLLFTDIEGSTAILERIGGHYPDLLDEHDHLMRAAIAAGGGRVVSKAGDSFFAAFPSASAAVESARAAQAMIGEHAWPGGSPLLIRMGIHSGHPIARDNDYTGMDVHRAARVAAVAHGGQVLLTDDARRALDDPVQVRDLGYHRLKDLPAPEHLFQLIAPDLRDEFPPLRSLNHSNLPVPPNPLVGRKAEMANALELLQRSDVRLVSLLGPGGVGKTRLALEVGAELATRYQHGVWIAALGANSDPQLVVPELCRVLQIEASPPPLEQALHAALRDRELLLVLDDLEHLEGTGDVVSRLLAAVPNVDVLATSREALRISGEHRLEVPPLPLEEARQLFRQRAIAVRPEMALVNGDSAAVERICSRLDGLPLALELAAARVAMFSPSALESRLARVLELPARVRDLPERQQTLRATIEWSYRMLGADERSLLQRLAPFIGGARVESAEWISVGSAGTAMDGLASLADKSLLRIRDDADGEPRFWMLETIRAFAIESAMADGLWPAAAQRHADHFFLLAERAAEHLRSGHARAWLDRLDAERANLSAALDHLSEQDPERAVRMAGALAEYWIIRGYVVEGHHRSASVLARLRPDSSVPPGALVHAGRLAFAVGEPGEAEPLLRSAAVLARDAGEQPVPAECLSALAVVEQLLHRPEESFAALHREAIAVARASGDDRALAVALGNSGTRFHIQGEVIRARPLYEEGLVVGRRGAAGRGPR